MSEPTALESKTFACIDAFAEIVLSNNDADALVALKRVRGHLDARIEQCTPRDADEDLL